MTKKITIILLFVAMIFSSLSFNYVYAEIGNETENNEVVSNAETIKSEEPLPGETNIVINENSAENSAEEPIEAVADTQAAEVVEAEETEEAVSESSLPVESLESNINNEENINTEAVNAETANTETDNTEATNTEDEFTANETFVLPTNLKNFVLSTDLSKFINDMAINGLVADSNGDYTVTPYTEYTMAFNFAETENLQFDNDNTLTFNLPQGLEGIDSPLTIFNIDIIDDIGNATIQGNTFDVIGGVIRVNFNKNDPNFERFKALGNIRFAVEIKARFDGTQTVIDFGNNVIKKFKYENNASLEITKAAKQVAVSSDVVEYTLTIKTGGVNENLTIKDNILGMALTLNRDVVVSSNKTGVLTPAITYNQVGGVDKGFNFTLDRTVDGEIITVKYTSKIDYNSITYSGTIDQTKNIAGALSNQVSEVTAEQHLKDQIKYIGVLKVAGDLSDIPNQPALKKLPWKVTVNSDKLFNMGGRAIKDSIASQSYGYLYMMGTGINIKVTKDNGVVENRFLPWDQLQTVMKDGKIISWQYNVPASDGVYVYEIDFDTTVDTSIIYSNLFLRNKAEIVGVKETTALKNVEAVGNGFKLKKEATSVTSKEIEWKIIIDDISPNGYPNFYIHEELPKITMGSSVYEDKYIDNSIIIEGLIDGETYKFKKFTSPSNRYEIQFYKSADQIDSNKGLKPTLDGQPRQIIIKLKSLVDQQWLALAHANGYVDKKLYEHKNIVSVKIKPGDEKSTTAIALPKLQEFKKELVNIENVLIGGVEYPVFNYVLTLINPNIEPDTIVDKFNTQYLKFYVDKGITIKSGDKVNQNVVGNDATAVDNAQGINITINSYPKNAGKFYEVNKVYYSLIAKDAAALKELQNLAINTADGYKLENTATWNGNTSEPVIANYTYYPYVDKELVGEPNSANGYIAEFVITVNKYAEDLEQGSDFITIEDELSPNLRLIPESISYTPNTVNAPYSFENNILKFTNLPDNQKIEIRYKVKVLGKGAVSYENTVKYKNFGKKVANNVTISYTGGGTGSNPSITLFKVDADDNTKPLANVSFQLFYLDKDNNNQEVAVKDKNNADVIFTTKADGKVLIIGNTQSLGWNLWPDRIYRLKEINIPLGYVANATPTDFILSAAPANTNEYDLIGETLKVSNTRIKFNFIATKTWVNGPVADHTAVDLVLTRNIAGGAPEVVNVLPAITGSNPFTYTWNNLPKTNTNGENYIYNVEEANEIGGKVNVNGNTYSVTQVGNDITNTFDVPLNNFTATKTWVNGPVADHTAVNLILSRSVAGGAPEVVNVLPAITGSNPFTYTWNNLPSTNNAGQLYTYSVEEANVVGGKVNINGNTYSVTQVGNDITNTFDVPLNNFTATKTWVNGPVADHTAVNLILSRSVAGGVPEVVNTLPAITGSNPFTYTWNNLPSTNNAGQLYTYSVEEANVVGGKVNINGNTYSVTQVGNDITNTFEIAKIDITATKEWINSPSVTPVIQVQLYRDNVAFGLPVEFTAGMNAYTWTNLDKSDINGTDYVYTVDEVAVPLNYTKKVEGLKITNTYKAPAQNKPKDPGSNAKKEYLDPPVYNVPATASDKTMVSFIVISLAALLGLFYINKLRSKK